MEHVKKIIEIERDRLLHVIDRCESELRHLPRGFVVIRSFSGKLYVYLNVREREKVISRYIGKIESEKAQEIIIAVDRRRQLMPRLKRARYELRELNKIKLREYTV